MAPKTKNETSSSPDEVPNGILLLATHLCDMKVILESIAEQLIERNSLLRATHEAQTVRDVQAINALEEATGTPDTSVLARIEKLEASLATIPGRMDELTALVKSIPAMLAKNSEPAPECEQSAKPAPANGEAKAIANRIIEHVVENAAPPKRGRGRPANPEKCPHPADKVEGLENGLRRCTRCGAVLEAKGETLQSVAANIPPTPTEKVAALIMEAPTEIAQKVVAAVAAAPSVEAATEAKSTKPETVYKQIDGKLVEVDPETLKPIAKVEEKAPAPAKVEAPKVTIDDVRAVAIGFADKHGKEKLGEVLRQYGQGNLSSIAPERYRDVMADLSAEAG